MISQHHLHITCACGRYRYLRAEDIPPAWLGDTGLNIHPWVFDRMVCLYCGRRGRPLSTVIAPVRRGGMSDSAVLPVGAAKSGPDR
ncbi:hypothetical protein [Pseudotabrizicola sp. 4114]|uniref:hypothetical protein n=1 Tax=Pseudotabrizicola sp. 4114 TaxID=2817731 RepID=UPI0028623841|nr:hypothetical protein [Pseudorhodobacter sp. 4114]